ncbi:MULTISPECIES: hypothetical protein [Mycobacterium]|jgi:hypothetical protein|uniref:Uncharacterized protein n=1 Tax=Mycobacterium triplex TaxID=47839 RepID=A0A024K5J4_9MYCO|nr:MULTISPECIES: hypothetical protein [Mycobacterium]CDO91325.1 hypothetical protein BN973_05732 [Mycobacterium triplex]
MKNANIFHAPRTRLKDVAAKRSLILIALALAWPALVGLPLHATAAPDDIDALIDDSGPLPKQTRDLTALPDLLFTTPSGLLCKKTVVKVMHDVTCAGDLPGAPAGTRVVTLPTVYAQANGPARFLPTPPERFFGDTTGQAPVLLPAGHKIVFWAFSNTQSLVCGVPRSADLVCRLNAPKAIGADNSGPQTHGFVIAAPHSHVF